MAFTLPPLSFAYNALEPWYDETTVKIHHTKHHQTYTDNLNNVLKEGNIEETSIESILRNLDSIPSPLRTRVINHGGGYFNHKFFWESLTPTEKSLPSTFLKAEIEKYWPSFDAFKEAFSAKALAHFGSGWVWLILNKENKFEIIDTHDQISPLSLGYEPLLTIDVWEHAYYLKYQNRRAEWIAAFWNIVNYECVEKRIKKALSK